jgi:MscS family membrane protein
MLLTLALVLAALLGVAPAAAQTVGSSVARPATALVAPIVAATAAPDKEKLDEEAPDSPRASMRSYFDLAERGRFADAAVYLDLPHGMEKRGPDLASKLYAVLSARLLVNPEQLSPLSQGKPGGGLPDGVEELGRIPDPKKRPVPIRIVHHESRGPDDEARWLFSQATLTRIDGLYGDLPDRWMREHLPAALLASGPLSISWWQWLAMPLLAALCLLPGRLLASLLSGLSRILLPKQPWSARLLQRLERPVATGIALGLFVGLGPYLALTIRAQDVVDRGIRALGYLIFFWALMRVVAVVGDEIAHGDWARTRPSARSLSAVGVKLGKVVVGALALMVALSELGYPATSVVAGLGIGGIALALAAQKTVENLFGSVAILADQPFRIGDWVRVDTVEGSIESIGLRSTRLRTIERTAIVIPNGKLADMRIENFGARDRIRFATKLPLARSTPTETVRRIVTEVTDRVKAHPKVRRDDVFVHLSSLGEGSYDVEVAAPLETTDFNEFASAREELLVVCLEIVGAAGATLAVPVRQLVAPPPNGKSAPALAGNAS